MAMKSLFLGLGKVNLALSKKIRGERRALVEEGDDLILSEIQESGAWKEVSRERGDFDTYDFSKEIPAQVFISPGIDPRRSFFKSLETHEIRELDLFCERFKGLIICITGTDGKSTFTFQLGEILKRAIPEKKIFVGGNLGTAMFDAIDSGYDIAILEISSFQSERLKSARPDFGILLNLATDHLDRYDSINHYFSAKWNLLSRSKECFYPHDLAPSISLAPSLSHYSNQASVSEILKGVIQHLSQRLNFQVADSFFENLPTLPHRMEIYKAKTCDRYFINDSKATTVHAAQYGVEQMKVRFQSIALILGGKYKGDEFRVLAGRMRPQDRLLLCGEARNEIYQQIAGAPAPISIFLTLADVLNTAIDELKLHQCLMLSPGCSSYDEFRNFEERGDFFIREVKKRYEIEKDFKRE
jgi:UDP-N-acetylmuramoylalanine--D-glutamate ligase